MLRSSFSVLLIVLGVLAFAYEALLLLTPLLSLKRFPNPAAAALLDTPYVLAGLGAAYLAFEHHRLRGLRRSAVLAGTLGFTGVIAFAHVLAPSEPAAASPVDANVASYFFFASYLTGFVAIALAAGQGLTERRVEDRRFAWIGAAAVLLAAAGVIAGISLGRHHLPLLAAPLGGFMPTGLVGAGALTGLAGTWALFTARRGVGPDGDEMGASLFVAAFVWIVALTGLLLDPSPYSVAWYVAGFARPLGMAVIFLGLLSEHVALYQEARDRQHDLEALHAAGLGLVESVEPRRAADAITTNAVMLTGASAAVLHRLDEASGELHSLSSTGRMPPSRLRNVERGLAATLARGAAAEARGVWTGDLLLDGRFNAMDEIGDVAAEGFRAAHVVPLGIKSGAVFGTLTVLFELPRQFSPRELELLETYARQAASAMDNAAAVERLLDKARHDEGLQDFARRLLSAKTEAEVVGDAARVVRRLLRADFAAVYVRDSISERFRVAAGSGWAPGTVDGVAEPPGSESLVGEAVLRQAAVQVEDLGTDSAFVPAPYLEANGVRAAFVAPLATGERVYGGIGVFWRRARRFRDGEARLLSVVAEYTALALPRVAGC